MKARNPSTGNLETVYVKALDSMPVGTIVDFDGTDIPTGWEEKDIILWTNTSTSNTFAPQTVNIDLSKTNTILIKFYRNKSSDNGVLNVIASVGDNTNINYSDYSSGVRTWNRTFTINTTGITFNDASLNGATNNNYLIPVSVIKIN